MKYKFSNNDIDALMDAIRDEVDEAVVQSMLVQLVRKALLATTDGRESEVEQETERVTTALLSKLPEIRLLLMSDVEAIRQNDPAAESLLEIMSCYPATTVMLYYRVAHALHLLGLPLLPRIITERAHSLTGIDIHPAASIGASFGIDHGTGIVIGATTIIGHHVMIYQGVTLGAKNFHHDGSGNLVNEPRHPIIEDNVTIYSNTSILGRIRIGHDSVIGGNLWITHDVEPYSQVRQSKPVNVLEFSDGAGI